jgi:hypothetical protein
MWDAFEVASVARDALRSEADRADLEQAVRGLDALDELAIHAVLRTGFAARYPVLSEQRYPASRGRKRRSEGERCDIVVLPQGTPAPGHLTDPLDAGTLFAGAGVDPREALWIEVKGVWHHAMIDGVARPNPGYVTQLTRLITGDLRKLAADEALDWTTMVIVAFHRDREAADRDLTVWREKLTVQGLVRATPIMERFPITDRIGNGVCTVIVVPVRERPEP